MIRIKLSALMGDRRESQRRLSEEVGISQTAIRKIYHEKVSGIRFDTLEKLCEHFNCEVGDLLERR